MFSIFKNERFEVFLVCVSAKSCSLTLYEFFNRQDLSAIETEKNKRFYSKHTAGSPKNYFIRRKFVKHKKYYDIVQEILEAFKIETLPREIDIDGMAEDMCTADAATQI